MIRRSFGPWLLSGLCFLVAITSPAAGQSTAVSSVTASPMDAMGTWSLADADSDVWAFPQAAMHKARGRSALIGGGIGLLAGGILGGLSVQRDDGGEFGESLAEGAATGVAVVSGALVGAALGALLGATVFAPSRPVTSGASVQPALFLYDRTVAVGAAVQWIR